MREILERYGFAYHGWCKVCSGQAELFKKGMIECKIRARAMQFTLIISGKKIIGKSNELQATLERYIPKEAEA